MTNRETYQDGVDTGGNIMISQARKFMKNYDVLPGRTLLEEVMKDSRFGNTVRTEAAEQLFASYVMETGSVRSQGMRTSLDYMEKCGCDPETFLTYLRKYYDSAGNESTYYGYLVSGIFRLMDEECDPGLLVKYVYEAYRTKPDTFRRVSFEEGEIKSFLNSAEESLPLKEALQFILLFFQDRDNYGRYLTFPLTKILYEHKKRLPERNIELEEFEKQLCLTQETYPCREHERMLYYVRENNSRRHQFSEAAKTRYEKDMTRLKHLLAEITENQQTDQSVLEEVRKVVGSLAEENAGDGEED